MLDCQSCENCGGCYDEGTKEPKLLSSCHHTLCLECIKQIMAKSGLFTCPFCSKTYPNIKQPAIFPTNLFIANSIFAKNHKKRKLNNNGDFVKTEANSSIPEGGQKQESVSCSNMPSSSENSRESNAIQDAPKTAESLHNSDSNNSAEQNNNNNNNKQLLKDSNENSLDQLLECKDEILTTEQNLENQDKKIEIIEKTLHRANNSSFSQPKQQTMTRQLLIDRAFESINSHSNPHSSHSNPHSSNQTLTSKIPTTIQSKDQSYLQSIQHSKAPSQSISIMASPLKCIPLSLCSAPHSYGSPPRPSRILFQSQENHTYHHPRNSSPRPIRNNCPDHSELLRYFCESHESSFCFRCHQHSFCGGVSLLETFSNDQMQKLHQLSEEGGAALSGLSSLAGHYRSIQDDLSDNLTSQIDKIENTFQQFIAKILRKKETIIQTIKTSTERVKSQVSMRINVVQSAITQCQRTNHQTLQIRSLLKKDRFIVASQAKQLNSATNALHTALNQLQKQFTQFTGQPNKDSQDIPKQNQQQSQNITQKQQQNQQLAPEKSIVQPSSQQLSLLQSLRMEQRNNSQPTKNEFKQPLTRPQYSRNIITNIEAESEENSESTDEYSKLIQSIALSSFSEFASNLLSDSREISKQFLSKVPTYSGTPSHPFDVTFQSQSVMVSAH